MQFGKFATVAFGALLGLVSLASLAEAKSMNPVAGSAAEKAALATAQISVEQAINIAEKTSGGKATGTAIDNQNDQDFSYDVTVEVVGATQHVLVDMQSGAIVADNQDTAGGGDGANELSGEAAGETAGEGPEAAEGAEENETPDEKGGG